MKQSGSHLTPPPPQSLRLCEKCPMVFPKKIWIQKHMDALLKEQASWPIKFQQRKCLLHVTLMNKWPVVVQPSILSPLCQPQRWAVIIQLFLLMRSATIMSKEALTCHSSTLVILSWLHERLKKTNPRKVYIHVACLKQILSCMTAHLSCKLHDRQNLHVHQWFKLQYDRTTMD